MRGRVRRPHIEDELLPEEVPRIGAFAEGGLGAGQGVGMCEFCRSRSHWRMENGTVGLARVASGICEKIHKRLCVCADGVCGSIATALRPAEIFQMNPVLIDIG